MTIHNCKYFRLKMNKKNNFFGKLLRVLRIASYIFFISSILMVIVYRFVNPPVTPLMVIRCAESVANGDGISLNKQWLPIDQISPNLQTAVIASEDIHFLTHFGFDFEAIQKANELNKRGNKLHGASTISQQTAKNVFLWPGRDWIRKGFEVYFTLLIETFWSKERIMEVYLNVIEMGDGVYGAEAASQRYFGKSAAQLNKEQSALIAAILPNPRKWHPDAPNSYVQRKKNRILEVMHKIRRVEFR
ncbi:MAG: monofunctional biosynthetic peptidoglycan transglycosylase [Bacteroidota bacterium]|nr:monofunctional biosynthetic peptidoglycan transglycosylase [Bacteroidota bacterium]